jgi:hypothetical protein
MLSLGSMACTRPSGPSAGHLDGQETWSGTDVHDVLAGTQGEDPHHLVALPDDVRGGVDDLDLAGGGGVELQHVGHDDLLGTMGRIEDVARTSGNPFDLRSGAEVRLTS